MAKAKTAPFTISEQVTYVPAGAPTVETISIGSLIDVGDAQALEVLKVDWILQGYDRGNNDYEPVSMSIFAAESAVAMQLTDKNSSDLISAADNNLVGSGNFNITAAGATSEAADFYPDDFSKKGGRFVVNDEMYLIVKGVGAFDSDRELRVTCRVTARVVKLSTRDWMAISLETVQKE